MQNEKSSGKIHVILWALFVLTTVFALSDSLQGLMFPLLIGAYLWRERLSIVLGRFPLPAAFIGAGLLSGLLIEIFAIFANAGLPSHEKILLHPHPGVDLLIAFFWYGGSTVTWYLLLRKVRFSKKVVYIFSALYGVFTEYGVLGFVIANPLIGIPLAALITAAYSIFPFIAYMLTEARFGTRISPTLRHYVYIVLAFVIFWAVVGNFVYNPLIEIFPKGF